MRDLVLAKKYAKKGYKVIFATQNLENNINYKIKEQNFKIIILKSNSKQELVNLINKLNIDLLVIDSYQINYKKEKYIKDKTDVKILSFDDTYQKHYCDILYNHNISANKKRYKNLVPKNCKLKCGAKYTLLRDEFKKYKSKANKKFNFFIAMGGADSSNINIQILKVLNLFPNINVNIVSTSANKNLKKLKEYCKNKNWIKLHINSPKVAKLMAKSDFAIITPSVVLNEVYFMNLPFIVIKTAKNQKEILKYIIKNDYLYLNNFNYIKFNFYIYLILNNIKLTNFISLKNTQSKQVLKMRNNKNIRQWMYDKNKISKKTHKKYIKNLKYKQDRIYFLVSLNNINLGVIDLTNISKNNAQLGIYTNTKLKGKGTLLLNILIKYSFEILNLKKLTAYVYNNNIKAISLYKKFGFEIISNKNKLIHMELNNENR